MYTQLALTESSDRAVAVSGLEKRLAGALHTGVRYGIFEKYLHRSLLWQRSEDSRLKRVPYPIHRKVPSWSWMAYDGGISYMDISFEQVAWSDAVQFPSEDVLKGRVRDFRRCRIEQKDTEYAMFDEMGGEMGDEMGYKREWLRFDENGMNIKTLKCIVIGRGRSDWSDGQRCYVLVVKLRCEEESCGEYERVGVGSIDKRHISFEGPGVGARIV